MPRKKKLPAVLNEDQQKRFDRFKAAYPHWRDGGEAKRAFLDLDPSDEMIDMWLAAIDAEKRHKKALKAKKQFCPEWKYPATWIRAEGWDARFDDNDSTEPAGFSFD